MTEIKQFDPEYQREIEAAMSRRQLLNYVT